MRTRFVNSVVPAKAGTHASEARAPERWIPAFAGMTVVVLLFLGFCGAAVAAGRSSERQILHILDRLAFGPSPADVKHVKVLGIDRYIAEQLDPASIPEQSALTDRLAALETLKLDPVQLFAEYGPLRATDGMQPSPEDQKARRQHARLILEQAQTARIWRALYSPRQLQEVMVDFWYNHFNVFANKAPDRLGARAAKRAAGFGQRLCVLSRAPRQWRQAFPRSGHRRQRRGGR